MMYRRINHKGHHSIIEKGNASGCHSIPTRVRGRGRRHAKKKIGKKNNKWYQRNKPSQQSASPYIKERSLRIFHNRLIRQRDILRSLVRTLADEPPDSDEDRQTTSHQTGVVHSGGLSRESIGEAEDDDEGDNIRASERVNDEADRVIHEEATRNERGAAGQDVREDSHEVGKTGQLHEAADEGVESRGRAEVDAGQDGDDAAAGERGVEGVVEGRVDVAEPFREGRCAVARQCPESSAGGDVAASGCDQGGQEGDEQKAQSAAAGAGGLVVDLGEGEERAVGDCVDVLDGVEDGDHVADAGDEADAHLGQDGLGDVAARLGDLFGQVRGAIRGSDTVGTVQHAHDEDEALLRVVGLVGPFLPHGVVGAVFEAVDMRHHSAHDDGDEDAGQDQEHANVTDEWQEAVHEEHGAAAEPGADDETDEEVPRLRLEARVHQGIHRYGLLGHDQGHGGCAEDPSQTIPPAGEETTHATILAGRDGSPMVDATGRGHARCKFSDRRGH